MSEGSTDFKDGDFKNRATFVVSFSAIILAFYPFKDFYAKLGFSFFGLNLSVFSLLGLFIFLLFLSTYFFGLNYVRYGSSLMLSWRWTKYVEDLAYLFFVLAFLFPVIIFIIWFLSFVVAHIPHITPSVADWIKSIGSILASGAGFLVSRLFYSQKEKDLIAMLNEKSTEDAQDLTRLESKVLILTIFETIINSLRSLLVPYVGLGVNDLPTNQVIEVARIEKFIDASEFDMLMELRRTRNQIAHANTEYIPTHDMERIREEASRLSLRLVKQEIAKK